jgi:hypothetical protein
MPSCDECPLSRTTENHYPLDGVDLTLDPVVLPRASIARAIRALDEIEALALARVTWNLNLEQARLVVMMLKHKLF